MRSMTNSRSSAPAYPAPNMVPERVVPVTCGTPVALSRTMVTSERGFSVRSTCPAGTPNEPSSKNLLSWLLVSPVALMSEAYLSSWSAECPGRVPNALWARMSASVALPFSPGGRMSLH